MGTSVTSEGYTDGTPTFGGDPENPQELFNDHSRGYVKVRWTRAVWSAEFRSVGNIEAAYAGASTVATYVTENGTPGGVRA